MSNLNRIKGQFTAAQQGIKNRNVGSCMRFFEDLCKLMSDQTLSVKIDPDLSDDKKVCFVFEGLIGSNNFQTFVNIEYELNNFYMGGFYPVLIIRDSNNASQKYSLADHASMTRAVFPLGTCAANIMAQNEAKSFCVNAWKAAFPSIPKP